MADSAVYKDYKRKRKLQMADDVAFWNTVFSTVVRKHKVIAQGASNTVFLQRGVCFQNHTGTRTQRHGTELEKEYEEIE